MKRKTAKEILAESFRELVGSKQVDKCPCGYIYDPEKGNPKHNIPVGTKYEDLLDDWRCPRYKPKKRSLKTCKFSFPLMYDIAGFDLRRIYLLRTLTRKVLEKSRSFIFACF